MEKGGHFWWPPFLKTEKLFQDDQVTIFAPPLTTPAVDFVPNWITGVTQL
jgi:hypothetical protein